MHHNRIFSKWEDKDPEILETIKQINMQTKYQQLDIVKVIEAIKDPVKVYHDLYFIIEEEYDWVEAFSVAVKWQRKFKDSNPEIRLIEWMDYMMDESVFTIDFKLPYFQKYSDTTFPELNFELLKTFVKDPREVYKSTIITHEEKKEIFKNIGLWNQLYHGSLAIFNITYDEFFFEQSKKIQFYLDFIPYPSLHVYPKDFYI